MSLKADEIYGYDAPNGFRISVMVAREGAHSVYLSAGLSGMSALSPVREEDVPRLARELLRGLHEAAGLPVPIVLDRVDENVYGSWIRVSERSVWIASPVPVPPLTLEGARRFAAALAGAVERAENEPDPAEVEALERLVIKAAASARDASAAVARAILAAGWRPPERAS